MSWFIAIPEKPGRCRWCRCTYTRPCEGGCGWANRTRTLCTACEDFDRLMRTVRGRAQLVQTVNDAEANS